MAAERFRITWRELTAVEPSAREVHAHAATLAAAYNEPHNRSMMGHDPMSIADVATYYGESREVGSRLFLLFANNELAGDADFRHVTKTDAEFAFMIGGRSTQGKGLGTRYAILLHAFAFRTMGLRKVYVTIIPRNAASRRVFEKIGYRVDDSPAVRARVDHHDDISLSISSEAFAKQHTKALEEIAIQPIEGA